MLYCSCKKDNGDGVYYNLTGQGNSLQVHSPCRLPSKMYFRTLTGMRAPKNAETWVRLFGRKDGVNELTWVLNDKTKVVTFTVAGYPDLLLGLWEKIDTEVKAIKESIVGMPTEYNQWRARAFGEVIGEIMNMTATEVATEALQRYEHRDDPEYETPGLATEAYEPVQPRHSPFGKQPKKSGNRIDEPAVATTKRAIESGMFTVKQIAESYKMTVDEVKEQLGLA
jgi:hypothetical protein